jgi:aldehyde:ferredoxin oxidoreductase
MKTIIGTNNRILEINLSDQSVQEFKVSDADRKMYLGGKGLGLKLLYDRMKPHLDPLGDDNYLAFMMGILIGTGAPCSGRFAGLTKSPLTGIMLACSCGGDFGTAFKTAGYDGLLIKGSAKAPTQLIIDENGVGFEKADDLWGLDTVETQEKLALEKGHGAMVIGPAGENKVCYANIASGHRYLGRGGMGAVMGAKNLKAITAKGKTVKIIPVDKATFDKTKKTAVKYIKKNHFVGHLYRNYGTSANVNICNIGGILPINNFSDGTSDKAIDVSGESIKETYKTTTSSCKSCTILCGHKGTYADGSVHQIPEYESIGLLGTNLGIFDVDRITEWNDLCGRLGMDTISAGGTLAWAMEATEKGIYQSDLKFESPNNVSETLTAIAFRRGKNADLANGTRLLSQKYGGKDFAIQVKGLELPAYDPRGSWGQGLAYAVSNRGGCHLSATTMVMEVFMGFLSPFTTRVKAHYVKFFEDLFSVANSFHTCSFTIFAYALEPPIVKLTPKWALQLTMRTMPKLATKLILLPSLVNLYRSITGFQLSQADLQKAGERIQLLERYMNTREGITRGDDTLPDRILKEARKSDKKKRLIPLEPMLKNYYKIRGYDENGVPKSSRLKKLGITIK